MIRPRVLYILNIQLKLLLLQGSEAVFRTIHQLVRNNIILDKYYKYYE